MAPVPQPAPRYYDLDALRAVAMFLGIVLHSSVFLLPDPPPFWPIHEASVSGDPTYKLVIETIHGFRMPVFFLLSGYFSALLWQRRGLRGLVLQRLLSTLDSTSWNNTSPPWKAPFLSRKPRQFMQEPSPTLSCLKTP
ncbi:MAG: acyltransferase family protein [Caldilineaceae bacterium SB0670_bin_27]|uniref:Acyltransferase family protein n=1 Tax=Caldilineaceae bacterium SB0664_bin_27 TaxID=2605260 RepID=A0A6B0YP05_9CHLR|nr:acyltransferase family protein [Caldilineaceae bacterium SB0664_bin_27]MYJ78308.1 acyltransferase family protein [Caldilineaceae bacterium SB0670_bin_27]